MTSFPFAVRTSSGPDRRAPSDQPRAARDARAVEPFGRAFDLLERRGHDPHALQRFTAARQQGCCHLCHMPYASASIACPCPHWFVMPWAANKPFDTVFAMYGLASIVHYLLVCARAERKVRLPYRIITGTDAGDRLRLELRVRGRHWTFELTEEGMRIALATRGIPRLEAAIVPTGDDAAIMRELVRATAVGAGKPPHGGACLRGDA